MKQIKFMKKLSEINFKNKYIQLSLLYLLFQIFNLLIIRFSGNFIPSSNNFLFYTSTSIFKHFANFDGEHYYNIAIDGYGLYEQAFFPLYPVLIKVFSVIATPLASGIIISNICFLAFILVFYKTLKEELSENKGIYSLLFLIFFPTSFYFVSYYTEGLFSLLFILSIYFLRKNKYFAVAIFAYFAALTKLTGIFLIIPIVVFLIYKYKKITFSSALALAAPILGFLTYSVYLYKNYGDFLLFLNVQPGFGANRSSSIILFPQVIYRYVKIFVTAKFDFVYFVSAIEFVIFLTFLLVLLWQLYYLYKNRKKSLKGFTFLLAINLFSLANLILPTMSGTFSSIPRYVLLSLGFFITLSYIKNMYIKIFIIIIFAIFHIILLGFFAQGYFIS